MDARRALQDLADKVKFVIIKRLRSSIGVNRAAGFNTLEGSYLEQSIDMYVDDDDEIVFIIADYFSYVTGGRRHGMSPPPAGTFKAIENWVRRKHIKQQWGVDMTENQIAFIVYRNLRDSHDIPPRPFIGVDYDYTKDASQVIPFLDKLFDKWADDTFNALMDELVISK